MIRIYIDAADDWIVEQVTSHDIVERCAADLRLWTKKPDRNSCRP